MGTVMVTGEKNNDLVVNEAEASTVDTQVKQNFENVKHEIKVPNENTFERKRIVEENKEEVSTTIQDGDDIEDFVENVTGQGNDTVQDKVLLEGNSINLNKDEKM